MNRNDQTKIECVCGEDALESPNALPEDRVPCAKCGSTSRNFYVSANFSIGTFMGLGYKHKRPGIKKFLAKGFTGHVWSIKPREMVHKTMLIDRENDRYSEHVKRLNGEVLRHVDEPLSAHRGRGSARRENPIETDRGN